MQTNLLCITQFNELIELSNSLSVD